MDFAQRVLSGQIKTAGFASLAGKAIGTVAKPILKSFGRGAATAAPAADLGASKGFSLLNTLRSPKVNLAAGGAAVGLGAINNAVSTGDQVQAYDAKSMAGNYDNTVRPLLGASMLVGAPIAAYLATRKNEVDDEP